MISKIILTALVILVAVIFVRRHRGADSSHTNNTRSQQKETATALKDGSKVSLKKSEQPTGRGGDMRLAAYLFLALMLGLGGVLYYYRWQEDHAILTVRLYRDGSEQAMTYEVYRYQLDSRSFVTTDGTTVTVADSERMEVAGLE
ncbi:MAG: hypothetical protein WDZ76_00140 [Pseudohongiellaceae bacterium]